MNILRVDLETRCPLDIRDCGADRYAEEAEIVIMSCAKNDEEVVNWDASRPTKGNEAIELFTQAVEEGWLIEAHNVGFEYALFRNFAPTLGIPVPKIEQLRCSAAVCRVAAIPHSLAGAGSYLEISNGKNKVGSRLIQIFSIPDDDGNFVDWNTQGKVTVMGQKYTYAQAWKMFVDYCDQDVRAEREIGEMLSLFDLHGTELDSFHFDLRMNERGVPFNKKALLRAQQIVESAEVDVVTSFSKLTNLRPTQTAKVLDWLVARGYPKGNLQSATMEEVLKDPPKEMTDEAVEALYLRYSSSNAASKKIKTILERLCKDGRTRGDLMWYGAIRTGRWSSTGVNIQNIKRPTIKCPEVAYEMIRDGADAETLSAWYKKPTLEIVSSTVRNFIEVEDEMILDADYSNIEGRVGAWICGQDSMLQEFRDGVDGYKTMASSIFGTPYEKVSKAERFVGKIAVLSCCYQTGGKTFWNTCATWGNPIEKKIAAKAVKTFRQVNNKFPETWNSFQDAALASIRNKEKWFDVNEHISFKTTSQTPVDMLIMKLPSGRCLFYPEPKVKRVEKRYEDLESGEMKSFETDEISYYGQIRGKVAWGRIPTYGGDLFQSATQATARDLMVYGCLEAEKRGFEIFSLIHDQALAHEGDPDDFIDALCTKPDWIDEDFPLVAEGGLVKRYSKD